MPNRVRLRAHGPLLTVRIGFDPAIESSDGFVESSGHECIGLLDTGASTSCIDTDLATTLGLPVTGTGMVYGADGEMRSNVYLAWIEIPELRIALYGRFNGVNLADGNSPARALVGRDFLDHLITTYDGPAGSVTVSRPDGN